jgi:hypothetical protein
VEGHEAVTFPRDGTKSPARPTGLPAGYCRDLSRPDVFDPALKHYRHAFVKGPSQQPHATRAEQSRLLRGCLHALARSPERDAFVLRGSMALESWFGERARYAHDIDLVVRDPTVTPDSPAAVELLEALMRSMRAAMVACDASVIDEAIALDSIWTYERAEGRRLTFPWRFDASRSDVVQIDVVFREPLQDPPILEAMVLDADNRACRDRTAWLWLATRAESLAWKLLWLETDMHPQPKDLYDALLLAEHVTLPVDLVHRVYAGKGETWKHGACARLDLITALEWDAFEVQHPELIRADTRRWVERLATAVQLV